MAVISETGSLVLVGIDSMVECEDEEKTFLRQNG